MTAAGERPRRRRGGYVVVTDLPCPPALAGLPVRTADHYLEGDAGTLDEDLTVVNLCRSYQYLTRGYYVSLVADARHQRVLPTLRTIEAVNDPFVYFRALEEAGLDTIDYKIVRGGRRLLPRVIVPEREPDAAGRPRGPLVAEGDNAGAVRYARAARRYRETTAVLGRTLDEPFRRPCSTVFKTFPVPLLRVRLYEDPDEGGWLVGQIFPVGLSQVGPAELELLRERLEKERTLRSASRAPAAGARPYRIACLWDEDDAFAPSDEATLARFERAAERHGALMEVIGRDDLGELAAYDALLIRTVTGVNHYSFAFAQAAESLDIPVIDDVQSIIRCSNKVFLHELFAKNGIPTPPTAIVSRKTAREEVATLGFPVIVKLPDGTFSHAVKKAEDAAAFDALAQEMFRRSPLLIVQAFTPTPFDWRIGVLEGEILFAARYHMAKDHWQIVGRTKTGRARYGRVEAVPIADVPDAVRTVALEAAALIGHGLYGVDVKEAPAGPAVVEVNDNPNILETDEDAVERDRVYERVVLALLRRIREGAEPR